MIRLFAYTAAAMSMFAASAQADDAPSNLNEWIDQASRAVEAKMDYPETANLLSEIDTNTFLITVNRQGDILEYTGSVQADKTSFDSASRKALRYVDLPDLPSSYKKDTLKFNLVMDYIGTEQDLALLHRADNIPVNQIAAWSAEKSASTDKPSGDGS